VVLPYAFVAYNVYVVVADGFTFTLVPLTAPAPGETITYDALLTVHDNVTVPPDDTWLGDALKELIVGDAPLGTFADVYTGSIFTTSKAVAGTFFSDSRSLPQRLSEAPVT